MIKCAYNRAAHLPERIRMMQAWADYLDGLRRGADVVPTWCRSGAGSSPRLSAEVRLRPVSPRDTLHA